MWLTVTHLTISGPNRDFTWLQLLCIYMFYLDFWRLTEFSFFYFLVLKNKSFEGSPFFSAKTKPLENPRLEESKKRRHRDFWVEIREKEKRNGFRRQRDKRRASDWQRQWWGIDAIATRCRHSPRQFSSPIPRHSLHHYQVYAILLLLLFFF